MGRVYFDSTLNGQLCSSIAYRAWKLEDRNRIYTSIPTIGACEGFDLHFADCQRKPAPRPSFALG